MRRYVDAVLRRDYEAAQECFHPDVTTETPGGTFHGAVAPRRALEKATGGYEHVEIERTEPQFEEIDRDVVVRTHELGRWRESGDVAFERDLAVRLTIEKDKITRLVVVPGGYVP